MQERRFQGALLIGVLCQPLSDAHEPPAVCLGDGSVNTPDCNYDAISRASRIFVWTMRWTEVGLHAQAQQEAPQGRWEITATGAADQSAGSRSKVSIGGGGARPEVPKHAITASRAVSA